MCWIRLESTQQAQLIWSIDFKILHKFEILRLTRKWQLAHIKNTTIYLYYDRYELNG